jgi:hypothetical protein
MQKLKQGTAAIAMVATLGLVMPTAFGGLALADISRNERLQPMTAECAGLGKFDVISADKEFTNANTEGGERFKMSTLQEVDGPLVLVPVSGTVVSVYTALDHDPDSETNPEALVPLDASDPRLAGGYPPVFAIPPGNPYSYFGDFSLGNKTKKKNLVDCVITDIGASDEGLQNWYPAGEGEAAVTDCRVPDVNGAEQDLCFVEGLVYHYTDIFVIKAQVSNNGGATVESASADGASKAQHGGKHRGKGKHGH